MINSTTRPNKPRVQDRLAGAVLADCRRHAVFAPGETVLVAVSGGPDSLCLLHLLHALAPTLGITLLVAHVHHGLRGEAADQDTAFVEGEARALSLTCTVARVDVRALARDRRLSLETAAREARYSALRTLLAQLGASCIATGHTEDDQAETLLLHLLRGSGLDGLAGMRPRRADLARPLLGQSRRAVLAFCQARGLHPRMDLSNDDRAFRRNVVRAGLLPMLERFNPRARAALARCASLAAIDAAYLHEAAEEAFAAIHLPTPGVVALRRAPLLALPPAIRSRVLRLGIERLLGPGAALPEGQITAILALTERGKSGAGLAIGRGYMATISEQILVLTPSHPPKPVPPPASLPVPGTLHFGGWRLETSILSPTQARARLAGQTPGSPLEAICDRAALGAPLIVRTRLPGDRFSPLGLKGSKKVQDILVDRKVPRAERAQVPIVVGPRGIAWLVGTAPASAVALADSTLEVVRIRAFREKKDADSPKWPV